MLDKSESPVDPYARSAPRMPLRRIGEELLLALALLTRLPVPRLRIETEATAGTALWAYPIVGCLVGLIGGTVHAAGAIAGLGALPSVLLGLAAMALATGAFHEDGLVDFADGLGGGQTRKQKLEIMRDSRVGTYGALALFFLVLLAASLLVELNNSAWQPPIGGMVAVFVCTEAIQRAAIGIPFSLLKPAREDGLAAEIPRPGNRLVGVAFLIAALPGLVLLGLWATMAAIAGAVAAALVVTALAARELGGRTGDVLGAAASLAGLASLVALAVHASAQAVS